jgi:hypothetical protein
MGSFFDAKFFEAMSSVFTCPLPQAGMDVPKTTQRRLGGARSAASKSHLDNQSKDSFKGFENFFGRTAEQQRGNGASLHSTSQSLYVPKPLHGWTSEEQLSLIAAAKVVPSERSLMLQHYGWTEAIAHHKYLLLISEKVPGKSLQECERCLNHLYANRVAYFGHRSDRNLKTSVTQFERAQST